MAKQKGQTVVLFLCLWVAAAAAQNLVVPAVGEASFEDQKNYYTPTPDPNVGSPPPAPRVTPPHRTSPPHRHGGSPPHHVTPTPPTGNCGNPPHDPTPSTPRGGGGGGSYYNPPPSTPSGGGGGSYSDPPPSTPTPVVASPPTTPVIVPGTPGAPTIPAPPFDPNSNPFTGTCNFWRNHPAVIWGLLGWWGTVGSTFGVASMPGLPSNLNLMQALSNTRNDGLGNLYREGTASFLNSMANARFPYTTQQVRERFTAALGSNSAAAAQARLFRLANEGHAKPRD